MTAVAQKPDAVHIVQALRQTLREAMQQDDRIVVMGEDVGRNGGVFRVTDGLLDTFGPQRVIDMPLAESAIIGAAIGMAGYGLKPIAEIQFFGFLLPAFEQVVTEVARMSVRSGGSMHLSMVIRAPYGGHVNSPELHSEAWESFFVHTPGLKVVAPATPNAARGLLLAAIEDPDPVLFLEPIRLYRTIKEPLTQQDPLPLGQARLVRPGNDMTLFCWSGTVPVAEQAAEQLEQESISVEVVDLQSLSPLDEEAILSSVRKTGRAMIVEEDVKMLGVGAEVAALLAERGILFLQAPVLRVAAPDVPYPAGPLESFYLPSVERVVHAARESMSF